MEAVNLSSAVTCEIIGNKFERRGNREISVVKTSITVPHRRYLGVTHRRVPRSYNVVKNCGLTSDQQSLDYDLHPSDVGEKVASTRERLINSSSNGTIALTGTSTNQSRPQSVQTELIMLSLPAIAGQAIEPLAQLMETAYIGRLGSLELASAGVSISIFNIISKVFNIPLLSVATSFVAEDISKHSSEGFTSAERRLLPSVSTALVLSVGIGIVEAAALYFGSGVFLSMMGISIASPMRIPAQQFLQLRAFGCPAVVLSLAIQGIFRGFKDTKTPVQCLGLGNLAAVFFFPILMYVFHLGVTGAAISTIASQYIVTFSMIWHLNKRTVLIPSLNNLQFGGYLKSGGFLLGRTLAAVMTITLSTSMAARQGPLAMAAHQIILQVWLSVSLLADAQAASGQALIASSFAKGDYNRVKEITYSAIKTGLFTGISLAIILGLSFGSLATLFTKDIEVLNIVRSGLLFISASQPITALAYIFDGLHYGVSDFPFAACSMMVVGAMSSAFLLCAPSIIGLSGVWSGLTLFMGLRTVAGFMRLSAKNGPWWFLQDVHKTEGLLKVSANGVIELLTDSAEGQQFKLTDGVDIGDDGMIYFTDASHKYSLKDFAFDIFEGRPYGRFMSYDPSTQQTKVLLRDLYFPNGVAVSPDQNSVVFCETPLRRCKKYYIQGERKGSTEIFVNNLPGMPDNIRYDGDGHYWIALSTEMTEAWYLALRYPFIRKVMGIMTKYVGRPHIEKNGGAVAVDLQGMTSEHYHDPSLSLISSAIKIGDYLYCGSIAHPYIIRLNLTQFPAISGT